MAVLAPYLSHHWPVRTVDDVEFARTSRRSDDNAVLHAPGITTDEITDATSEFSDSSTAMAGVTWFLIPRSIAKRSIAAASLHRDDVAALQAIPRVEARQMTALSGPVVLTRLPGGRSAPIKLLGRGRTKDDTALEMQLEKAPSLILVALAGARGWLTFKMKPKAGGDKVSFDPTRVGPRGAHAPGDMVDADEAERELLAQFDTTEGPLDWVRGRSSDSRKSRLQQLLRNAKNRSKVRGITGAERDVAQAEVQYFNAMLANETYATASEKKKLAKAVQARKKIVAQMKPGTPLMESKDESVTKIREELRQTLELLDASITQLGMKDTAAGAYASADESVDESVDYDFDATAYASVDESDFSATAGPHDSQASDGYLSVDEEEEGEGEDELEELF